MDGLENTVKIGSVPVIEFDGSESEVDILLDPTNGNIYLSLAGNFTWEEGRVVLQLDMELMADRARKG